MLLARRGALKRLTEVNELVPLPNISADDNRILRRLPVGLERIVSISVCLNVKIRGVRKIDHAPTTPVKYKVLNESSFGIPVKDMYIYIAIDRFKTVNMDTSTRYRQYETERRQRGESTTGKSHVQ